jgi:hypothetical protein
MTAASQLPQLRASPIGRWLRPAAAGGRPHIDIGRVIRERAVVLFSLGSAGQASAAARIAWLVGQDVLAADQDLCDIGVDGDGIAWFDNCEGLPQPVLRDLIIQGARAGLPAVLTTTSARAGVGLADEVNVLVIHRMPDAGSAGSFASRTGERLVPEPWAGRPPTAAPGHQLRNGPGGTNRTGQQATPATRVPPARSFIHEPRVSATQLQQLGRGEFVLVVRHPERLVPAARTVAADPPAVAAARPAAPPPAVTLADRTPAGKTAASTMESAP